MHPDQPVTAHQPLYPAPAHAQPPPEGQFGVHPSCAISAAGRPVHVDDHIEQVRVVDVAGRRWTRDPVVARAGHLQYPARHRGRQALRGELADEPEPYFGRTFSLAK